VNGIFENRFDIILTNPPFGSRVEKSLKITEADKYTDIERIKKYQKRYGPAYDKALEQVNQNIGKPFLDLYQTGAMSTLTEVLFIERCLNLLKPGGRMGIVLPEGVLNNTNLQKVRDFVESKAKIILITSIPQDVFIASGATVKPSLLFFKKFTEDEAEEWKQITQRAKNEISTRYAPQMKLLEEKLALRGKAAPSNDEKRKLQQQLRDIQEKIESEIKIRIKKDFDYKIPIAEVEKAGISTTGAEIENELIPLSKEFTVYRMHNHLWENKFNTIKYEVTEDGKMFRIPMAGEPLEIYW
jgi:type I restriction enzyme M protein